VAQLDNVHSDLRLDYEMLKGLISLASLSVAKPTLSEISLGVFNNISFRLHEVRRCPMWKKMGNVWVPEEKTTQPTQPPWIPLAGWILSVVTFAAGTLIPFVYQRVSHEGFSMRQPQDVFFMNVQNGNTLTFGILLKITNARKDSLILEDIVVSEIVDGSQKFTPVGIDVRALKDEETVTFPIPMRYSSTDQVPLLIRGESERLIELQIWFRSEPGMKDPHTFADLLLKQVMQHGLTMACRLDGKNRTYTVNIKKSDRY
jgi:hypothetical protein